MKVLIRIVRLLLVTCLLIPRFTRRKSEVGDPCSGTSGRCPALGSFVRADTREGRPLNLNAELGESGIDSASSDDEGPVAVYGRSG
jgi:hypothetical protein